MDLMRQRIRLDFGQDKIEDQPLCIMGDFNSIRRKEDRMNCAYQKRDTSHFNSFMETTGMIEIEGTHSFTWYGPNKRKSKLDRVVVNTTWLNLQVWKLTINHRRHSDHCPLLLHGDDINWGSKHFKAFDDWQKKKEVISLIDNILRNCQDRLFQGTLKEIKSGIKQWCDNRVSNQQEEINSLENRLKRLDNEEGKDEEGIKTFTQLQKAYQREVMQLRQRSRVKWDLEGDCNTRFFHRVIQQRRRSNQIYRMRWKEKVAEEPSDIKNLVLKGFKNHFCRKEGNSPFKLSGLNWTSVSKYEVDLMIRHFTKEEIWLALQETDSRKAPGPDGFNAGWIKMMWPKISEKIVEFFRDFHEKNTIPGGVTFLSFDT